jgi:hypothetical protein
MYERLARRYGEISADRVPCLGFARTQEVPEGDFGTGSSSAARFVSEGGDAVIDARMDKGGGSTGAAAFATKPAGIDDGPPLQRGPRPWGTACSPHGGITRFTASAGGK